MKAKKKADGKRAIAVSDKAPLTAWWIFGAIVFVLVIAIRIRLLGVPLERDEGEYAYAGQLMLEGVPPYKLAYNMKFPGIYAAYAAIMALFGQSAVGIHLGLLLVNAATIVLVFFLGRRLVNVTTGIAAAIAYAILSVSQSVYGQAGHATHFVVLPVLGAILLLLRQSDQKALLVVFGSGILFGIGVLMKQPAIFFALLGPLYIVMDGMSRRLGPRVILFRNIAFGMGAMMPLVITGLLLWSAGVFDKFWFWTFVYASRYATLVPLSEVPAIFATHFTAAVGSSWMLWLLAGLGLILGFRQKEMRGTMRFLLGFLVVAILALSSGFYFRGHYFVFILPVLSLLVGIAVNRLATWKMNRFVPLCLLVAAISIPLVIERTYFFTASPTLASRLRYTVNPFPESIRIAEYLRNHTEPNDTIGVLGSEPQIFFYSGRRSATGYIYMYSLMEPQSGALSMQQEMIREIEQAQPKYLVSVKVPYSWFARPDSETLLLKWATQYLATNYDLVGVVDIVSGYRTDYHFDELPKSPPSSSNTVGLYRRKT